MTDPATSVEVLDGFELVCQLDELEVGRPAAADVAGLTMAVVRTSETQVHAIDDTCTHAHVSLSEGDLHGCELECWMHGSRFDLRTGKPSGPPATEPVGVYAVRIVDGAIWIATMPTDPSVLPKEG